MAEEPQKDSDSYLRQLIDQGRFHLVKDGLEDENVADFVGNQLLESKKSGIGIVSIVGGAASGKSSFARRLAKCMGEKNVVVISTDDFLIGFRNYRREKMEGKNPLVKYDFDFLKRIIAETLSLTSGEVVLLPEMREKDGTSILNKQVTGPVDSIIVEGDFQPLDKPDYIIYLHVPDSIRLKNRIRRDLEQRSENSAESIERNFFERQVLQHFKFTLPVAAISDLILRVEPRLVHTKLVYRYEIYAKA